MDWERTSVQRVSLQSIVERELLERVTGKFQYNILENFNIIIQNWNAIKWF